MSGAASRRGLLAGVLTVAVAAVAQAAGWPEVTAEEWALEVVDWYPSAPAVILRHEGTLRPTRIRGASSSLEVFTRVKILSPEGVGYGTVSLESSEAWRLRDLEARTLLPDGRVIEVPEDATFTKNYSADFTRSVVTFVLPEVVPGAILEYRYRRYFDSLFFPEPWFFQTRLPVLLSRWVCDVPTFYYYDTHMVCPQGIDLEHETDEYVRGTREKFTARRVPPLPDEPFQPPPAELVCRGTLLIRAVKARPRDPVLDSWRSVLHELRGDREYGYYRVRADANSVRKHGKRLAADLDEPRARAATVYRWVRDEMVTRPPRGISPGGSRLDQVFRGREGTMAQKALVLHQMLDALDIESSIGLTGNRFNGSIDPAVVDPTQFNATIVVAQVGGERVFLDPSDPRLGYGVLSPGLGGMPCLLLDERGDTWVDTPLLGAAVSRRSASVHLVVDEHGSVAGAGTLVLTGYHAVQGLKLQPTDEGTRYAWQSWLERRMPGFVIGDVILEEDVDALRVEVRWRQLLREEQVLGDEVALPVADPLALDSNPFTLGSDERSTPVLLGFPDSSEVLVEVSWPPGWRLDGRPRLRTFAHPLGSLESESSIDPDVAHRAVLKRTFTVRRRYVDAADYPALRQLYSQTVANDAEQLVLVREQEGL